jgi:hypothetical protein
MSVRRISNHGKWVWQARVAFQGLRRAAFRHSREEARQAEAELLSALKVQAGQTGAEAARPATLRQLLEYYALDMRARGKGEESIIRVRYTRKVIEDIMPEWLDKPVSAISDAEVFAFRNTRAREGTLVYVRVDGKIVRRRVPTRPSTINRDLRTLRAALKKARPEYRFPAGAFFPEDETRVRWLRPEEELLVLEPMRACTECLTEGGHIGRVRTLAQFAIHGGVEVGAQHPTESNRRGNPAARGSAEWQHTRKCAFLNASARPRRGLIRPSAPAHFPHGIVVCVYS